jgi:hypothetical protein
MINKITFISTFLLFNTLYSQTSFEYETATDNGNNLTETINGITVTTSYTDVEIVNAGSLFGSTANIAASNTANTLATFTFSEPVDVTSIFAIEGNLSNIDYTFTPTGGANSPITESLTDGNASVTLNWTEVTSFTVTSTSAAYGFDDLIINSITLSTNDFSLKTIKVFPNPSSNFIEITELTARENYEIYNTLGQEIKKGIVPENKKIDIQNLTNGIYFLKFEKGNTLKFIKE